MGGGRGVKQDWKNPKGCVERIRELAPGRGGESGEGERRATVDGVKSKEDRMR